MKNLLIVLAFILSNCEIQPNTVKADDIEKESILPMIHTTGYVKYGYTERTIENMTYGIYYLNDGTSQTGYTIAVINITKDMLEVELLRKQLTSK